MHRLIVTAVAAAAALLAASSSPACELFVEQAWVREAPPTARVRVAYALVRNPGETAVAITGASSPAFGAIELHETREVDGVARMRRLPDVEVPAGGEVRFEPGGKHFMLFRSTGTLTPDNPSTLSVHACEREFIALLPELETAPSP